jgi:VWFA-related protein
MMQNAVPAGGHISTVLGYLPLLFLIAGQCLPGQTVPPPENPTISVNVNLVVLHATVLDRKGGFVSGVQKEGFHVYEDGAPQVIRVFDHEDVPVAVGLAVDNSGSMSRKRKDVTAAARAFVRASNPLDEMFVVNFNERVTFGLPDTRLFSASTAELERALNGIPASGRTALYDAIEAALNHLKKATLDKKVLIVISDGGDNASHHKLGEVLDDAGRSDAIVYTVGLFDEAEENRNRGVLMKIARATGGEALLPQETSQVVAICEQIATDVRNQYTIGYVPSNQKLDSTRRTIKVTATGRHGEKLLVRTRAGYIAPPERTGQPVSSQGKLP